MKEALVVIGNFDGVHRGHQAVLAAAHRHANERDLVPRLMTFDPHPAITLGRPAPPMLTQLPRKLELAKRACPGLEPALMRFTKEFAAQTPEAFVADVLKKQLNARLVMVGANFRFGRGRSGDLVMLKKLGTQMGFDVIPTALEGDDNGPWSSTRVRKLIAAGEMTTAAQILTRPHMISGVVSQGDQRGRKLGFPTCNITDALEALPPFGVYAVLIDRIVNGPDQPRAVAMAKGVANLGVRPTIREGDSAVPEAHAFDFSEDIYGKTLRVHLVKRLRPEKKFSGLDALKAQIAEDSAAARTLLADTTPKPSGAWA